MHTNSARFIMERSVERIAEKASEIHFQDYDALSKVLNEFTQLIAHYYDLFDAGILKNIASIEVNLRTSRDAVDTIESIKYWENAISELMSVIAMIKKESVL